MEVRMDLAQIVISETRDQQLIVLRERNGERVLPIVIGLSEALAIDRRVKGVQLQRPMTHDLLANVIESLGGQIDHIVINDLREHTFIATLYIRRGEDMIAVDSRPSDAIALGSALQTPIYVAEHVLASVLNDGGSPEERIELLRKRLKMLRVTIAELERRLGDDEFTSNAPDSVLEQYRHQLREMQTEYEAIDQVLKKLG